MERALAFYTGVLPFEKISEAELAGDAVEHLTGVFGARLRVVRLRLGEEHIELIEYLAPPTGRPMPVDTQANDLWHWQVQLAVDDVAGASAALRRNGGRWVSPGAVDLGGTQVGFRSGLPARDPDGHALLLIRSK